MYAFLLPLVLAFVTLGAKMRTAMRKRYNIEGDKVRWSAAVHSPSFLLLLALPSLADLLVPGPCGQQPPHRALTDL